MTPEIRRYLQDIVVFMRVERGVDGGVTAYGNVCFVDLAKSVTCFRGFAFADWTGILHRSMAWTSSRPP